MITYSVTFFVLLVTLTPLITAYENKHTKSDFGNQVTL